MDHAREASTNADGFTEDAFGILGRVIDAGFKEKFNSEGVPLSSEIETYIEHDLHPTRSRLWSLFSLGGHDLHDI